MSYVTVLIPKTYCKLGEKRIDTLVCCEEYMKSPKTSTIKSVDGARQWGRIECAYCKKFISHAKRPLPDYMERKTELIDEMIKNYQSDSRMTADMISFLLQIRLVKKLTAQRQETYYKIYQLFYPQEVIETKEAIETKEVIETK